MSRIALIGSGTWGTAIAHLLASKGESVRMWTRSADVARIIDETHRNPRHLPDVDIDGVVASTDFQKVLRDASAAVFVVPSSFLREVAAQCAPFIDSELPVIVLTKGIEAGTGYTMVKLLEDVLGNQARLACLSGPNHAEEVSRGLPTATVVASRDDACARFFQELFNTSMFRVYVTHDVTGVELCAASKNIIAIANGMCCAMHLGDNASAALMTRGLSEVTRLVVALGGDAHTCLGLAGVGDLIATCSSPHSRNRSLGEFIVEGGTLEEYELETHMVAEGAVACKTVTDLARKHGVEMPISELVRRILWEGLDPRETVDMLFDRPTKAENDLS